MLAKRAMKDNLFTEVYLSTAVTTPIQLKGWVNQANPYERHGQRWHLYLSRVEILRRLASRATGRILSPRRGRSRLTNDPGPSGATNVPA